DLFLGFVDLWCEFPPLHIDAGSLRGAGAFTGGFPYFGGDGVHVGSGHRRVYCAHVDHASGFDAVQPDVAADRRSMVKLKDELAVSSFAFALFSQRILFHPVILSGGNRFACEWVSGVEGPLVHWHRNLSLHVICPTISRREP